MLYTKHRANIHTEATMHTLTQMRECERARALACSPVCTHSYNKRIFGARATNVYTKAYIIFSDKSHIHLYIFILLDALNCSHLLAHSYWHVCRCIAHTHTSSSSTQKYNNAQTNKMKWFCNLIKQSHEYQNHSAIQCYSHSHSHMVNQGPCYVVICYY